MHRFRRIFRNLSRVQGAGRSEVCAPSYCRTLLQRKAKSTDTSKISTLFVPIPVKPDLEELGNGVGKELAGNISKTELIKVLNKFFLRPEVKTLCAEHGLDCYLQHQAYMSFRRYCSDCETLPVDLHVVISDVLKGASHVTDVFPYFLKHSRQIFPHLDCMDDLKRLLEPKDAAPLTRMCILGETLLNPLVGNGVEDKEDFAAEESAVGLLAGEPLVDIPHADLTDAQLKECLKEYEKVATNSGGNPQLPPGVTPDMDSSLDPYLPFTNGKEELISDNEGEYRTTYGGVSYGFKDKGYVVMNTPEAESSTPVSSKPVLHPSKNKNNKDEIELWYNAFVSVMSKYL